MALYSSHAELTAMGRGSRDCVGVAEGAIAGSWTIDRGIVLMEERERRPSFALEVPPSMTGWRGSLLRAARPMLERVLRIEDMNWYADEVKRLAAAGEQPLEALNRLTGVHPLISPQDLARIPAHGPLVVVSNHPFGAADPQALATLLLSVRPDARFIANRLLGMAPFLDEKTFLVDIFGGRRAVASNAAVMQQAIQWVADGGCLCLFPAGEVGHISWTQWRIRDPAWSNSAARIARRAGAAMLPLSVEGRNSALFYALGLVHPILRSLWLPREYFKSFGRGVHIRVGAPLSPAQVARFPDAQELTRFLRARTDLLAARRQSPTGLEPKPLREHAPRPAANTAAIDAARGAANSSSASGGAGDTGDDDLPVQPVALVPQHSPAELASEVSALPAEAKLLQQGDYEVYCTTADSIPLLMLETGRLRELAFRAVGEGSGRSIDIDRFDRHYRQLFVWNARRQELVGAYRMGLTDEILPTQGIDGLYTSTLFEYSPRALQQLGPAIELGRSYVRREYQRRPLPLMLLWRGIGVFLSREPRYAMLFGPVSISDEYLTMSKKLLIAFLETHRALTRFAETVKPRNPPQLGELNELDRDHARSVIRDVDEVDQALHDLENGERAMPVLLRQYLRLNAKLLAFNVDPQFGNVVDALLLVDMRLLDPRILQFYMGREKAAAYRAIHGLDTPARGRRG